MDNAKIVVGRLELPRYPELGVRIRVHAAAGKPRQRLNAVELSTGRRVEAQLEALPLHVRLTGNTSSS